MNPRQILIEGAKSFNLTLTDQIVDKFFQYKQQVIEWNEKINLTAITQEEDFILKHFLDSISVLKFVNNSGSLLDIGTGAGFPGIPIKLIFDKINITLMDSLEKRVKFLKHTISLLDLKGIDAIHGRAEDLGQRLEYREKFDICIARAVASLPVLMEYSLPFIKIGGTFIAMKAETKGEIENSQKALQLLGGKIETISEFILPMSDHKRTIICIKKIKQTSFQYPRKAGKPAKDPL